MQPVLMTAKNAGFSSLFLFHDSRTLVTTERLWISIEMSSSRKKRVVLATKMKKNRKSMSISVRRKMLKLMICLAVFS